MIGLEGLHSVFPTIIGLMIAAVRASLLARVWLLLAVGLVLDRMIMSMFGVDRHQITLIWSQRLLDYLPARMHDFAEKAWVGPLGLAAPVFRLFEARSNLDCLLAILAILSTILIWGLIGSAICRIAMTRMVDRPIPGVKSALKFVWVNRNPVYGPFCSVLGTLTLFVFLLWLSGKLMAIPVVGPILEWVLIPIFIVPTIMAVFMTLGLVLGWPLVLGAAMAEADDAFDSYSRSQTYLFQAPFTWLISFKVGVLIQAFAWGFLRLMVWATVSFLTFGVTGSFDQSPSLTHSLPSPWMLPQLGTSALSSWVSVIESMAASWPIAFEFSCAASIYLIMRLRVDGISPRAISHECEIANPEEIAELLEPF